MVKTRYIDVNYSEFEKNINKAGAVCELFPCLGSTNTKAAQRAAEGAPQWHTVIAKRQTGGKGRLNRSFYSPEKTGLYMSVLLRPRVKAEKIPLITTYAAVCVFEAIKNILKIETEIKWVNDILLNSKKICGILAESAFSGGEVSYVVLGIGINLFEPEGGFPEEIKDTAAALLKTYDENIYFDLAAEIIKNLINGYEALFSGHHIEEYRRLCKTVGKDIYVISSSSKRKAFAKAIDKDGGLLVQYEDGEEEILRFGEISVREY